MLKHGLALRLCKTISDIDGMPHGEFVDWLAYFQLTAEG